MSLDSRNVAASAVAFGFTALVAISAGCGGSSGDPEPVLFGAEGNRLRAYTTTGEPRSQIVIEAAAREDGSGGGGSTSDATLRRDVNGQICFLPSERRRSRRFVMGEDTGQPAVTPGWGVFELHGVAVGDFSAEQVGRLVTTFQPPAGTADPYGCGVLSDGRIVTTDIGNNASGPATGQLTLWFGPHEGEVTRFCKLDVAIGTAGGIWVDAEDRIYVASARDTSGVLRYTGPFPTSNDAAGGCGRTDVTGAPLADRVNRERFIVADANLPTPNSVVGTSSGEIYVSSVVNGVIAEFDATGAFVRRILQPPAGETLGFEPYSTGTPLGIAVDRLGTVYYADLGLVVRDGNIGPGPNTGSDRRIRFVDGEPRPPETFLAGLAFPDGVGVLE
jgi:hypothetical protein